VVRRRIQFILSANFAAVHIVFNFRHQRLHERLVTTNQSDGVPLLPPTGVATHLDAVRVSPSGELRQIRRNSTLRKRRAEEEAVDTLALRVRQARQQIRLETLEQSLEQTRHTRENMDVSVNHCNRNPHVIRDEDGLLLFGNLRVMRQFDHAQFCSEPRGWLLPVEMGLHGMGSGEFLHPFEGWLVQFQLQAKGLGYRLIGYIIVAFRRVGTWISFPPTNCNLICLKGRGYGRWSNSSTSYDKIVVAAHATDGLDDFTLIVGNDFDALKLDSELEAVFGEVGGVGVDGLAKVYGSISGSTGAPLRNTLIPIPQMSKPSPFHQEPRHR